MDAPLPDAIPRDVAWAEQLASMCQRASLFEETSLRMARRVDLVEAAISHLHRSRPSVDGVDRCVECLTPAPCRTKVLLVEVLL